MKERYLRRSCLLENFGKVASFDMKGLIFKFLSKYNEGWRVFKTIIPLNRFKIFSISHQKRNNKAPWAHENFSRPKSDGGEGGMTNRIKYLSREYSLFEEYLMKFYKGKNSKYSLLLAVLPWNRHDPTNLWMKLTMSQWNLHKVESTTLQEKSLKNLGHCFGKFEFLWLKKPFLE